MALSSPLSLCFPQKTKEEEEKDEQTYRQHDHLIRTLPKSRRWRYHCLHRYDGFWFETDGLRSVMAAQQHFAAVPGDILLATLPKTGTTWLKALAFAVLNRHDRPFPVRSLASFNPHECVPFLEYQLYTNRRIPDPAALPSPRLLATHLPFSLLPPSVAAAGSSGSCKIMYLCRNPRDTFVSLWHFFNKLIPVFLKGVELRRAFECFIDGVHPAGPFADHVLEYWKASQARPREVLFMRYEELKREPAGELRRLAEFMGCPFSKEEETEGAVEKILEMCCFESMRSLKVNQSKATKLVHLEVSNKIFFRRGEVGDWANHLTPDMVQGLDRVIEEKFDGSGLSFTEFYAA